MTTDREQAELDRFLGWKDRLGLGSCEVLGVSTGKSEEEIRRLISELLDDPSAVKSWDWSSLKNVCEVTDYEESLCLSRSEHDLVRALTFWALERLALARCPGLAGGRAQ